MANTVQDLIVLKAFIEIGVVQPGGSLSSAILDNAFDVLQNMWASWGTEEATSNVWYHQTFSLIAGTTIYTLGTGGTFTAAATPVKAVSWQANSGNFKTGGKFMSFQELEAQSRDGIGMASTLPTMAAADNAYPSIALKFFPTPAPAPGMVIIDYFSRLTAFASLSADPTTLAPEYLLALWTNLAVLLYPNYQRANYDPTALFANAQNAKAVIAAKNQSINMPAAPAQAA